MPAFPGGTPTAADLDAVVPERPVFLPNRDHHGAWVNSRAMEIAGIDASTPDPPDGRIERDADGRPSGTLHEGATALVSRYLPRTSGEDYYAALMEGQRYLHSLGVTSWQDAIVGAYSGMDDPGATYAKAAAQRRPPLARRRRALVGATARGRAGRGPRRPPRGAQRRPVPGPGDQGDAGRRGRERHRRDADAVPRRRRSRDRQPRALVRRGRGPARGGRGPGRRRLPGARARDRRPGVPRGARRVRGHRRRDRRHHIAHIQVVHPDDVPRFAELGRRRQRPGAVGLRGRADDRADAARSSARSGRRGSTPSATCTAPAPAW